MSPAVLPVSNSIFTTPPGFDKSQIGPISAYTGVVPNGNMEGADFVVVAWKLSEEELEKVQKSKVIYLCCLGGLPPHFLTPNFLEATHGTQK